MTAGSVRKVYGAVLVDKVVLIVNQNCCFSLWYNMQYIDLIVCDGLHGPLRGINTTDRSRMSEYVSSLLFAHNLYFILFHIDSYKIRHNNQTYCQAITVLNNIKNEYFILL